jgi:hypothetical protein
MKDCRVNYFNKRGQIKIQQMAFVLVAVFIFFSLVALFFFAINLSGLKDRAEDLREKETIETVRKLAASPEFAFTSEGDCDFCVDFDKILMLKDRKTYEGFWKNIAFLEVRKIYPSEGEIECALNNYPDCNKIQVINLENTGVRAHGAFVSLCRYDEKINSGRCEIGKIIMGFETIE